MASEWYRRTTWTKDDQADFEARLARARKQNRAQYLRIQASHLMEAANPALTSAALELLNRMLAEYPSDIQVAQAHAQRAECHIRLEELDKAIEAFRCALAREREFPNVRTTAWLDFGWLVVDRGLRQLYDEALRVLTELKDTMPFPVQRYKFHAIRALVAAERGALADAREEAKQALEAGRATRSGFRYHPTLGLVRDTGSDIHSRLEALARSAVP
ncbi:MAG: tetratricopeptide repeat protein [Candidatus Methylomirabilales bacterium]